MSDVVVRTTAGRVRGARGDDTCAFLGVPYAAPPVGSLRFAPPQRVAPWDGVRQATSFGATAPQPTSQSLFPQIVIEGDDYLHINVHTPDLGAAGLPVLVWIHGGGMVMGSNADPWTQGDHLAARGIVVVSMNYRLGVEGFLPLRDADPNRGVQDWLLALEWVQDNIAAFGGNPGCVTIGGHSAGSAAVLILSSLPATRALAHRVLAMSGVPWNMATVDEADAFAAELVGELGVEPTVDGLGSVPLESVLEIQQRLAPVAGISGLLAPLEAFAATSSFRQSLGPVIDGSTIEVHPLDGFAAGAGTSMPLMIGSTRQETDALVALAGDGLVAEECTAALAAAGIDPSAARRWVTEQGGAPAEALGAALTAISFRAPVLQVVEARLRHGAPTFVYETTWRPQTPIGTVHGIDLPYVFDTLEADGVAMLAGGDPPTTLRDDMSSAVVSFVATGEPGWSRYDDAMRSAMCFDLPSSERPDHDRLLRQVFLNGS